MGKLPLLALVLALGACAGGGSEQAADERCLAVPVVLVSAIESGLTASEAGSSIRFAEAVKSKDFPGVFFVSADLEGPGLEGADDLATWATTGLGKGALIFAVDQSAREFSDWVASDTRHLTMSVDGADVSQACARAAAR